MKRASLVCLAVVLFAASAHLGAQNLGLAQLEVNLGPLALDYYDGCITNSETNSCDYVDWVGGTTVGYPVYPGSPGPSNTLVLDNPACGPGMVYRSCIQGILINYAQQGVVGVRFQFAMNGGCCTHSTPFLDGETFQAPKSGAVNPSWLNNLALFFQDLRAANIRYVTFTPDLNGGFGGDTEAIYYCGSGTDLFPCTANPTAVCYPWLPYCVPPNDANNGVYTDPEGYFNDFELSMAQGAWGWGAGSPFITFLDDMLQAAQDAQLTVRHIDLIPESRFSWYPVLLRMVYDNTRTGDANGDILPTPVLYTLGLEMRKYGFDPLAVTLSTAASQPEEGQSSCSSAYLGSPGETVGLGAGD